MITVNFPLFLLGILPIWAIYRATVFLVKKKFNFGREIVINIFFIYILAVIYLTFFPFEIRLYDWQPSINLVPIEKTVNLLKYGSLRASLKNVVGNILLLSPLGIFLPLLFARARSIIKILTAGLLTSVLIEAVQLMTAMRICDIDDVIFNTAGTLLGYLTYLMLKKTHEKFSLLESMVEDTTPRSLLVQAMKPVIIIGLFTIPLCLISFYQNTYSVTYSYSLDKSIYLTTSGTNTEIQVESILDYEDYKIVLTTSPGDGVSEKIDVHIYRKVMFNRVAYIGNGSFETKDFQNAYDSIGIMPDKDTMLNIVYGKNGENLAAVVEMARGNDTSSQILSNQTYFVSASTTKIKNVIKGLQVRLMDNAGNNITDAFYSKKLAKAESKPVVNGSDEM